MQTNRPLTQEEAETFAAKLTRIWRPGTECPAVGQIVDGLYWHYANHLRQSIVFVAELNTRIFLRVDNGSFVLRHRGLGRTLLRYSAKTCAVSDFKEEGQKAEQFVQEWLPVFRRNCFLSGCNVERSAHEEMEWMHWLQEREQLEVAA